MTEKTVCSVPIVTADVSVILLPADKLSDCKPPRVEASIAGCIDAVAWTA